MTSKHCRKPTVLDALAMVAAVAVGLAWTRHFQSFENGSEVYPAPDDVPPDFFRIRVFAWWILCLSHCVAVVTLGVLLLRLRKPRPRLRSLTRQPGAVACGAVVFAVSVAFAHFLIDRSISLIEDQSWDGLGQFLYFSLYSSHNHHSGVVVASAWLLLALSGRWRREPGWIDGLGIALGIFWMVHPIFQDTMRHLEHLLGTHRGFLGRIGPVL